MLLVLVASFGEDQKLPGVDLYGALGAWSSPERAESLRVGSRCLTQ